MSRGWSGAETPTSKRSPISSGHSAARLEINAVFEDEVVPLKLFEGDVETPPSYSLAVATPTR